MTPAGLKCEGAVVAFIIEFLYDCTAKSIISPREAVSETLYAFWFEMCRRTACMYNLYMKLCI